jgi:hypothetical protein
MTRNFVEFQQSKSALKFTSKQKNLARRLDQTLIPIEPGFCEMLHTVLPSCLCTSVPIHTSVNNCPTSHHLWYHFMSHTL